MHSLCCIGFVCQNSVGSSNSSENYTERIIISDDHLLKPRTEPDELLGGMPVPHDADIAGNADVLSQTLNCKQPSFNDESQIESRSWKSSELCSTSDQNCIGSAIAGPAVGGIMYLWVNFGKGWRPRWFFLQDGILSYYKVHGPDKISITSEEERDSYIVGDDSMQFVRKQRKSNNIEGSHHKVLGALHLKVSSFRKSKTDDKKFYIFTGTKTLKLRVKKQEDKKVWLESLQAVKDRLLKVDLAPCSISLDNELTISTKNLRSFLSVQGLTSPVVLECEKIVLSEFKDIQGQLKVLQQNYAILVERLRLHENISSDSEGVHNPQNSTLEMDQDEIYFDTQEVFSSFRQRDSFGSISDLEDTCPRPTCSSDPNMGLVGFNYPYVKRRKRLPEPKEKEKGVGLWSLIKDNIGKDLTRVCLPVYFNEPLSSLQKCFEDLEYSYLLDRAYEWGKRGNSLMRLLNVAAFAVSGYASTQDRTCKPFNPLLGETYEADFPDKGLKFISEKVSHHPMIVACHCDGNGWKFWGDSTVKSKFWGRSIQLDPVGILTLQFEDGEVFQWNKVTTSIYNLILGKLYCDHYGTMRIQGNGELCCRLTFKEQSIIDRNPHQVHGFVLDKNGRKLASLLGKWDESIYFIDGDIATKPKGYDPMMEAKLLWERSKPSKFSTRYNLTSFAIKLNEITPGLKDKLPPTDSRLRPDQRYLENGEYDAAFAEKLRLEEKQRMARKLQETGWLPQWFRKENDTGTYQYIGGYWESRSNSQWHDCPDIFGLDLPEIPKE